MVRVYGSRYEDVPEYPLSTDELLSVYDKGVAEIRSYVDDLPLSDEMFLNRLEGFVDKIESGKKVINVGESETAPYMYTQRLLKYMDGVLGYFRRSNFGINERPYVAEVLRRIDDLYSNIDGLSVECHDYGDNCYL